MLMSERSALPAPEPPVPATEVTWEAPQLQDRIWIQSLCLSSTDSPAMPSSFKKKSTAMSESFRVRPGLQAGWEIKVQRQGQGTYLPAGWGRSATSLRDTVSSSSWKWGRRKATARNAPGFPGTSITSMRASRNGLADLAAREALAAAIAEFAIKWLRKSSACDRLLVLPSSSRIIAFR